MMLHVHVEVEYNGEYLDLVVEGEFDTYCECTDLTICDEHGKRLPADFQNELIEEFDTMMEVQRNPHGAWQAIQTLTEQLTAAHQAANEAEAYAEELEQELNTCRTVPLPKTQDEIAWDRLPDWAEWVARDEDGRVHCAEDELVLEATYCYWSGTDIRIDDFPGIVLKRGTCDWKDSKQRRPKVRE